MHQNIEFDSCLLLFQISVSLKQAMACNKNGLDFVVGDKSLFINILVVKEVLMRNNIESLSVTPKPK